MAIRMHMPKLASVRGQTLLTDTKPYLYRQSPVVAEMLDDMLTGGTVAWNQLQANTVSRTQNGVVFTFNAQTGELTVSEETAGATRTGTGYWLTTSATTWTWVQNHIYFVMLGNMPPTTTMWYVPAPTTRIPSANYVFKNSTTRLTYLQMQILASDDISTPLTFKPQVFDLTQMFGTVIADYVYSLETQTAGSGIAFLQSYGFFTEDYYPYDVGSLLSVKTSAHETVGFNLFDKSTASADTTWTVNGTQGFSSGNTSSALIRVVPSASYFVGFTGKANVYGVYEFDASQNYIGRTFAGALTPRVITLPSNCYYVGLVFDSSRLDTVCFNLSDASKNGTYAPYASHTYPLSNIELRGIPKLDASNNLYYDGDTYESSGAVTRKYGIVDLGTLSWYAGTQGYWYCQPLDILSGTSNFIAPKWEIKPTNVAWANMSDGMCGVGAKQFRVKDSSYSTSAAFKSSVSGVYLAYELETPTTETTDAFENPQLAGTTEEYIDTRTVPIPVGHTTEYFDMVQKESISMHMPNNQPIKMHMPTV